MIKLLALKSNFKVSKLMICANEFEIKTDSFCSFEFQCYFL